MRLVSSISKFYKIVWLFLMLSFAFPYYVKAEQRKEWEALSGENLSKKNKKTVELNERFIASVALFSNKQINKAKEQLQGILNQKTDFDAAWYYTGLCELYLGNIEKSQQAFTRAVELDNKNYWYRDRLAMIYAISNQEDLTISAYEKLLKDFPEKTDLYYNLVNLYLSSKQYDKALRVMDDIENLFGKDAAIATTRYSIYQSQNKMKEAFEALKNYNEDNSSPTILSLMGQHKMSEYEDSTAMQYFSEALELDSDCSYALMGKTEVYRLRRDYQNFFKSVLIFVSKRNVPAEQKNKYLLELFQNNINASFIRNFSVQLDSAVDIATSLHPEDTSLAITASQYYYSLQRSENKIREIVKNVKKYNAQCRSLDMIYLQILADKGEWEEIIKECDTLLVANPNNMEWAEIKIQAYHELKKYRQIIDICSELLSFYRKQPDGVDKDKYKQKEITLLSIMGDVYYKMGKVKKAFSCYEEVLKLDKESLLTLNNYAYFLSLEKQRLGKALAMSKKTIEKEPNNPTYLDTYAWILYLKKRPDLAKPYFKKAMLYGGKEKAELLDHYAEVLYQLKEYELAKVYWTLAKQKNTDNQISDLDLRVEERLSKIK